MRMTYEEFKNEIAKNTESFLPKELKGAAVEFRRNEKLNHSYDALVVHVPGEAISAALDIGAVYERHKDEPFEAAIEELKTAASDLRLEHVAKVSGNGFDMTRFDKVKDSLYIRCSNADRNREVLETCPHLEQNGLAMTVHIGLDWEEGDTPSYSTPVIDALVDIWGISEKELFDTAIENSAKRMPASFRSLSEVISEMMGGVPAPEAGPDLYVLTNTITSYGAAAVYYPGMLEKAHEQLGDFYMLPSSIHEWLLLSDNTAHDISSLEDMVRSINRTEVADEDVLSDDVYHFDGTRMELARTYEARMEATKDAIKTNGNGYEGPEPDKAVTM